MKKIYLLLIFPLLCGFFTVVPFFIVEWIFTSGFPSGIPWSVFVYLFVVGSIFFSLAFSVMCTVREGNVRKRFFSLAVKIFFMGICLWSWFDMFLDQLPCFFGETGC